jgi:hypothetical protein
MSNVGTILQIMLDGEGDLRIKIEDGGGCEWIYLGNQILGQNAKASG